MRRAPAIVPLLGLVLALAFAAAPAAEATSLTAIERQVMCVTCKIPLEVAESPQANAERAYIETLIVDGHDEAQIKSALVGQYGPAVLGLPAAHGFDLAAYLVPIAVVLALIGLLAIMLPRWRREAPAVPAAPGSSSLSAADAARLESDLARFD